jgi:hypothetical protein
MCTEKPKAKKELTHPINLAKHRTPHSRRREHGKKKGPPLGEPNSDHPQQRQKEKDIDRINDRRDHTKRLRAHSKMSLKSEPREELHNTG